MHAHFYWDWSGCPIANNWPHALACAQTIYEHILPNSTSSWFPKNSNHVEYILISKIGKFWNIFHHKTEFNRIMNLISYSTAILKHMIFMISLYYFKVLQRYTLHCLKICIFLWLKCCIWQRQTTKSNNYQAINKLQHFAFVFFFASFEDWKVEIAISDKHHGHYVL